MKIGDPITCLVLDRDNNARVRAAVVADPAVDAAGRIHARLVGEAAAGLLLRPKREGLFWVHGYATEDQAQALLSAYALWCMVHTKANR